MPIVHIELLEGRTIEQKREMVKRVTEVLTETVNCPKEAVTIVISEMPKSHLAKAGVLQSDN